MQMVALQYMKSCRWFHDWDYDKEVYDGEAIPYMVEKEHILAEKNPEENAEEYISISISQ